MIELKKTPVIFTVLLLLTLAIVFTFFRANESLPRIHSGIEARYQNVAHISIEQFETIAANDIIVFDVRQPEEHAVSHLPNAILLDPSTEPDEFLEDFGAEIAGKNLIFYCSVGRRSSDMLSRLLDDPNVGPELQYSRVVANLEGGVFAWINSERNLVDSQQQETSKVHPYNDFWGKLIDDKSKQHYQARKPNGLVFD